MTHADRIAQLHEVEKFSTLVGVDKRLSIPKMIDYRNELRDVITLLQLKLDKIEHKLQAKIKEVTED